MYEFNTKTDIEELLNAVEVNRVDCVDIEWHGVNIQVRPLIGCEQMIDFVRSVSNACFDPETLNYNPELRDFMIRLGVIIFYTNISMPDDFVTEYELVYGTNLFDEIISHIDTDQYASICNAISDRIEHRSKSFAEDMRKQLMSVNDAMSSLTDAVSTITDGFSSDDAAKLMGAITNGSFDTEKFASEVLKNIS